jgi:deoxyribose-phosphate aldolase
MRLDSKAIAGMIDISAVRAQHGEGDICELVERAKEYRFKAVHVLPCWVPFLRSQLAGEPEILIGAPVGFPAGGHTTAIKVAEARLLVIDGAQEIDMMLNVGKMRSRAYAYVAEDIRSVVGSVGGLPVKVILEVGYLSESEIKKACEICIESGATFVKTSTGWASSGATLENIKLITGFVKGAIKVKAAGNIRNLDTVIKMRGMGVERFGINLNAAAEIVRECAGRPNGAVEA